MSNRNSASKSLFTYPPHQIAFIERGEHSLTYMLSKPETTSLSVTITATTHQALIVHGDVQPVVFQYGPHDFDERIHWLYSKECDHYVLEKASIGMGGREHLLTWDEEKAKSDIKDLAEEVEEGGDADDVLEVLDHVEDGYDAVIRELYDLQFDAESLCNLGLVYSQRLLYAHAAICWLNELLLTVKE